MFGLATSSIQVVPCILHIGQSNGDGNGQGARLANTLWNYKGIATGYPSTRVAQAQYSASPVGVHIYNKQAASNSEWMLDNGVWQPYTISPAGNSRNRSSTGQIDYFGSEAIVAQVLYDRYGKDVFIIKPSFPGTSLASSASSIDPGSWNDVCRTIATQAYIQRAVRDFEAYQPGKRLKLVGVQWWQGEGDAGAGRTSAEYQSDFALMRGVINSTIRSYFVQSGDPIWNIVKLDYNRNAAETTINNALSAICNTYGYNYITQHTGKSLQKGELTTAQDDPVTKGVDYVTANSSGGFDDNHSNYIAHQIVGEIGAANIINSGIFS